MTNVFGQSMALIAMTLAAVAVVTSDAPLAGDRHSQAS